MNLIRPQNQIYNIEKKMIEKAQKIKRKTNKLTNDVSKRTTNAGKTQEEGEDT